MPEVRAIVGLGNPGDKYRATRHNIGFEAVDRVADRSSTWKDRSGALTTEVRFGDRKIILIKPMTYMNCSGEPLQAVLGFFKVGIEEVVVVHDEIDLPLGTVRIRKGGGAGGHRGIESVMAMCGGPDFVRVRVGVGRPVHPGMEVADWVLGSFSKEEQVVVEASLTKVSLALESLINEGLSKAQQKFSS